MKIKKEYDQIIELEYLDSLASVNNYVIIPILLYFISSLKDNKEFKDLYDFDIIKYGFQGHYPVIGVRNLSKDSIDLEEVIENEFNKLLRNSSFADFVNFSIKNNHNIILLSNEVIDVQYHKKLS